MWLNSNTTSSNRRTTPPLVLQSTVYLHLTHTPACSLVPVPIIISFHQMITESSLTAFIKNSYSHCFSVMKSLDMIYHVGNLQNKIWRSSSLHRDRSIIIKWPGSCLPAAFKKRTNASNCFCSHRTLMLTCLGESCTWQFDPQQGHTRKKILWLVVSPELFS